MALHAHHPPGFPSPFASHVEVLQRQAVKASRCLTEMQSLWSYQVQEMEAGRAVAVDGVDVDDAEAAFARAELVLSNLMRLTTGPDLGAIDDELPAAVEGLCVELNDAIVDAREVHKYFLQFAVDEEADAGDEAALLSAFSKYSEAMEYVSSHPPTFFEEPAAGGGHARLELANPESLEIMRRVLCWSLKDIAGFINDNELHPVGHPVTWNGAVSRACVKFDIVGTKTNKKPVDDEALLVAMLGIKQLHPESGYKSVVSMIDKEKVPVPRTWSKVRSFWRLLSPFGSIKRQAQLVRRGVYHVYEANVCWHFDGNHHFDRFKMVIHLMIDGATRRLLYLHVADNNYKVTVASLFLDAIQKFGVPKRTRCDNGGENTGVIQIVQRLRERNYDVLALTGTSVYNQRAERFNVDLLRLTNGINVMLREWERGGALNAGDDRDLVALHYVLLPFVQDRLDEFAAAWDVHRMSTMRTTPRAAYEASVLRRASKQQPVRITDDGTDFVPLDEARAAQLRADTAAVIAGVPEAMYGVEDPDVAAALAAEDAESEPHKIVASRISRLPWWTQEYGAALAAVSRPPPIASLADAAARNVEEELFSAYLAAKAVVWGCSDDALRHLDDEEEQSDGGSMEEGVA